MRDSEDHSPNAWAQGVHELLPALNIRVLLSIARRCPQLPKMTPADVRDRISIRARVLGVAPDRLAKALSAFPTLVTASPTVLTDRAARYGELVGLPPHKAAHALLASGKLLALRKPLSRADIQQAAALLSLNANQYLRLARTIDPHLAFVSPASLQQKLANLKPVLSISPGVALRLVVRNPNMLRLPPGTLQRNLDGLAGLLRISRPQALMALKHHPQLLTMKPATLVSNYKALHAILALPHEKLRKMIRRQPHLLRQTPLTVMARAKQMAAILAIPLPRFSALAAIRPDLLTKSPERICRNIEDAARALAMERCQVRAFMLRCPQLLSTRTATLCAKATALASLARHVHEPGDLPSLCLNHAMSLTYSLARFDVLRNRWTHSPTSNLTQLLKQSTSA
jgi:hypothetical protein